eukprot:scaffold58910_cov65-Phaeocystis_antarctica.AAC.5
MHDAACTTDQLLARLDRGSAAAPGRMPQVCPQLLLRPLARISGTIVRGLIRRWGIGAAHGGSATNSLLRGAVQQVEHATLDVAW